MSTREKEADLTEAEGSVPGHLELEDEKREPHSDDDTHKPEDKPLLSHEESFLHWEDVLQETRVNNPEYKDLQNVPIKKEDEGSNSDSDTDDNVKVTIGNISRDPSICMALLASQNSQASQTFGTSIKVTEDSWKTYSDNQCDVSGLTNINQSLPFQTVDDNLMTHTDNMTKESKNISGTELYTDFSPFVEEQLKVEPLSKLKLSATTDMMGGQARLMKTVEGIHHFKQAAESPCQDLGDEECEQQPPEPILPPLPPPLLLQLFYSPSQKYFQQQQLFTPSLSSLLLPTTGPAQPYFPHYPFSFLSSNFNPQEFPPREPITDSSIISDPPGTIVEVPWISGQNEIFSSSGSNNWEPTNWNPDMSIYRLQEDEESQECQNSKRSKYEQELDVSSKENLRT